VMLYTWVQHSDTGAAPTFTANSRRESKQSHHSRMLISGLKMLGTLAPCLWSMISIADSFASSLTNLIATHEKMWMFSAVIT
jgi:hypothetical protein